MAYTSIIASSAAIRGNLRGEGSLQILGRVEGDVSVTGDLELGSEASVVGNVSAARIVVSGSIEGEVRGTDAVIVEHTGRVIGDLSAPRIGMGEGAIVRGNVQTQGASEAAPAPAPVTRAAPRPVERAERAAAPKPVPRRTRTPVRTAAAKPAKPSGKKKPPPPVVRSPRAGSRARKKAARR